MTGRLPAPLRLYAIGAAAFEPGAAALLRWRERHGKEDPLRLPERRGVSSRPRPEGPLVWLHGASIGETLSLLPIVERLARRHVHVLVTSGTRTSAELLARRLPPGALHQFVPVDVPRYVRRFLDHWRPDLALVAESEIWPNTILELDRRGVPLILVNARLSERSFQRWLKLPDAIGAILARFALCLAQSKGDAERLARLGAPRVVVAGNLKFDANPPPADPHALAALSGATSMRKVWVAASTHPGEEEIVGEVHRALKPRLPSLLTIIAPRHPDRGEDIAAIMRMDGLTTARRALGETPERGTDIYVADTIGELGLFYRLCPLVLMGGSLVPHGGQNPIEPAKLGAAILHGPRIHNFSEVFAALDESGGALPVEDGEALARALGDLLLDAGLMRDMARAAGESVGAFTGAIDRTMAALEPFLARLSHKAQV